MFALYALAASCSSLARQLHIHENPVYRRLMASTQDLKNYTNKGKANDSVHVQQRGHHKLSRYVVLHAIRVLQSNPHVKVHAMGIL